MTEWLVSLSFDTFLLLGEFVVNLWLALMLKDQVPLRLQTFTACHTLTNVRI